MTSSKSAFFKKKRLSLVLAVILMLSVFLGVFSAALAATNKNTEQLKETVQTQSVETTTQTTKKQVESTKSINTKETTEKKTESSDETTEQTKKVLETQKTEEKTEDALAIMPMALLSEISVAQGETIVFKDEGKFHFLSDPAGTENEFDQNTVLNGSDYAIQLDNTSQIKLAKINSSGNLTFKGSGSLKVEQTNDATAINVNGNLTVESNVNIDVYANTSNSNFAVRTGGALNVLSGKLTSHSPNGGAVYVNGKLTIENGFLKGTSNGKANEGSFQYLHIIDVQNGIDIAVNGTLEAFSSEADDARYVIALFSRGADVNVSGKINTKSYALLGKGFENKSNLNISSSGSVNANGGLMGYHQTSGSGLCTTINGGSLKAEGVLHGAWIDGNLKMNGGSLEGNAKADPAEKNSEIQSLMTYSSGVIVRYNSNINNNAKIRGYASGSSIYGVFFWESSNVNMSNSSIIGEYKYQSYPGDPNPPAKKKAGVAVRFYGNISAVGGEIKGTNQGSSATNSGIYFRNGASLKDTSVTGISNGQAGIYSLTGVLELDNVKMVGLCTDYVPYGDLNIDFYKGHGISISGYNATLLIKNKSAVEARGQNIGIYTQNASVTVDNSKVTAQGEDRGGIQIYKNGTDSGLALNNRAEVSTDGAWGVYVHKFIKLDNLSKLTANSKFGGAVIRNASGEISVKGASEMKTSATVANYCGASSAGTISVDEKSLLEGKVPTYNATHGAVFSPNAINANSESTISEIYTTAENYNEEYKIPFNGISTISDYNHYNWAASKGKINIDPTNGLCVTKDSNGLTNLIASRTDGDNEKVALALSSKHIVNVPVVLSKQKTQFALEYVGGASGVTNIPDNVQAYDGDEVTLSVQIPHRDNYTFTGWLDQKSNVTYQASDKLIMPEENVKLIAQWEINENNVRYNPNGSGVSNMPSDEKADAGQEYNVSLLEPNRVGYKFIGWKQSEDDQIYNAGGNFSMPDKEVVLTAQWEKMQYSVTYEGGAENVTNLPLSQNSYFEDDYTVNAQIPVRDGYTFIGWLDAQANAIYDGGFTFKMPARNVALVAQWQAIETPVVPVGPTPQPPAPNVPAEPGVAQTIAPATAAPTGEQNPIADEQEIEEINPDETPKGTLFGRDHWALINLILAIAGVVLSLALFISFFIRKSNKKKTDSDEQIESDVQTQASYSEDHEEDKEEKKQNKLWKTISIIFGIMGIIVFLITEDMSNPMVYIDGWTPIMIVIAIAQVVALVMTQVKRKDHKDEDEAYSQNN